jgi:hypothetical protein
LKGTLFIFLVLIGLGAGAQSKVAFHAPDSMTFVLSLNDVAVNIMPVSDIAIVPINAGKTKVKMTFTNSALGTLEQVLDFKDKVFVEYEVRKVKTKLQYFLLAESPLLISTSMESTVAADSVAAQPSVPEYDGISKCNSPLNEVDFSHIKMELSKCNFELTRFEYLKKEIPNKCWKVDQLRYLLSQLDMEDNKIKILELATPSIYDFDRAQSIVDDFFLERNKIKVKAILQ